MHAADCEYKRRLPFACPQVLFGCLLPLSKEGGGTEWGGGVKVVVVSVCIMNFGLHAKDLKGEILAEPGITLTNL